MDFVEDVSPHQLRHAAIPNDTIDYWERRNMLALGELVSFVRHSSGYGMTFTKMNDRCPGNSKRTMSEAYNALLEHGFLVRLEFTYARPEGTADRSGQRFTKHKVSRVRMSEETFAELVAEHAPGKYVVIPYGGPGEKRRVKILAAEIYCHLGGGKITSEKQIIPHEHSRGGKAKKKQGSYAAAAADETPAAAADETPAAAADETPAAAADETPAAAADETPASPESTHLTSGATRENAEDPLVAPESTPPESGRVDSSTKYGERTTNTNNGAARALAPLGCAPVEPTGSDRPDSSTATCQDEPTTYPADVGEVQTARESHDPEHQDHDGTETTLTQEQARDLIRQVLTQTPTRHAASDAH